MQTPYWEYYLAIEDDLIRTGRFVEFHADNMQTFSIEFARLLLASSSEVDVVAKELCKAIDATQKPKSIDDYRAIITSRFPKFHTFEIQIPRYSMFVKPWDDWGTGKNPSWWRSYNNVKHERNSFFHEATLKNTLSSVASLFCLLLYYYKLLFPGQYVIDPWPKLLDPKSYDTSGKEPVRIVWNYTLPDVM